MNPQEKAFLNLVEDNQGIVHKVCSMYTDDDEGHKDLFQEIMLQLWRSFPRFRQDAKVSTWMYKVALHTAITSLKRKKRKEEYLRNEMKNAPQPAWETTAAEDEHEQLYHALEKLKATEKALVMLYLEEKNYKEISEIIGISENNVGVRLNRIKKKLRQLMTA